MNYQKFMDEAKKIGLESFELYVSRSYRLGIELFHQEISSYTVADVTIIAARGIYQGKMGYAYSELNDNTTPLYLAEQVKENAKAISSSEAAYIFEGSFLYKKKKVFSPNMEKMSTEEKIQMLHEIETKLRAYDTRIVEVGGVSYEESISEVTLINSYGLELKHKSNDFMIYAEAVAKENDEVKTGYKIVFGNDPTTIDVDDLVKKSAENALSKLGGAPAISKDYPCVFSPKVFASLMSCFLSSANAEEVLKHSSSLENKLGDLVASKKVTIIEDPLMRNVFFRYFDDEGVATSSKTIVERGVLKTYLHNLSTVHQMGVAPTGNGYKAGAKGKVGISLCNVYLKPGKHSEEEMLSSIIEGVYINDVQGLHAGMNMQSGNFSLQAAGFMIRNGKIAEPINLITIAGNLFEIMKNVKDIANNVETQLSSITCPSVYVRSIAISGK